MRNFLPPIVMMAIFCSASLAAELLPEEVEFFEQKIRPVLVEQCYECHNTAETSEAELSLDYRDALLRGGESGSVIAIAPDDSLLLQVIRHEIDGLEMPEGGAKLGDEVIADFEKWVAMGAPDPRDDPPSADDLQVSTSWEAIREKRKQWWSFQPIVRPEVPDFPASDHPVDRFIGKKLQEVGLCSVPQAKREVLARRLSFALTGLPPSPDDVSRFVHDMSTDAYERYVDRLLDSKAFGERWARHWMDWIRYAESHGSEGDPPIVGAHYYRDYLIRSLNHDVPYDQMVREHIAGDLIESPRMNRELGINESQVATAHWRMVFHGFAPTDALDEKVRFVDDAINVFSKAFLGLTVSCARCHDHKFDAISQADYYAFFGIIGSTRPGRAAIDAPERLNLHREELTELKAEIRRAIADDWIESLSGITQRLAQSPRKSDKPKEMDSLAKLFLELNRANAFADAWDKRIVTPSTQISAPDVYQRWELNKAEDHQEWFAYGNGTVDQTSLAGEFSLDHSGDRVIRGIYPAGVYSHLISDKHGAVLTSPQVHLDGKYDLWLRINGGGKAIVRYVVQDYPRNGTVYPVTELQDQKDNSWRWQKYDLAYWDGDDIHIELATANDSALLVKNEERSWFGIREAILVPNGAPPPDRGEQPWMQLIRDEANSAKPESIDEFVNLLSLAIRGSVEAWRHGDISDSQALLLAQCIREGLLPNSIEPLAKAWPLIERYRKLENQIPVPRRAPTLSEWMGADQPLYNRGDHRQPSDLIPRRFLEAIDPTPYESNLSGRLQLSKDVLREDNPLTARVIVNRIWHHLFGRGIVGTNDNFGRLGQTPTHPELLDFLAYEFRNQDKWSIKSMIRRIVTSQAWRQDSVATETSLRIDPNNELYSYYSVRRLEAEAIRDAMLSVSGQLDDRMYGDSVSGNTGRRGVYVRVIRNKLDPFLSVFDLPVPFSSKGRRDVTNVPAQSLLLMNDPFVVQSATHFANRAFAEPTVVDETMRVEWMWQQAFGRPPTEYESQLAASYLSESAHRIAERKTRRDKLLQEIQQFDFAKGKMRETVAHRMTGSLVAEERKMDLRPIAEWLFDGSGNDSAGDSDLQIRGTAKIADGALVLNGDGWAETQAFQVGLKEKTIEAIVQLDDLQQRGGGVMTIQDLGGSIFDSIVFAERKPNRWLAGSNHHRRTRSFDGLSEAEASLRPVHLVMTYNDSGIVTLYRDGVKYGNSFKADVQPFAAGDFHIVFGMRHGRSAGGNRMLRGRIFEARLYDRALTSEEVAGIKRGQFSFLSTGKIIAAMTDGERRQWDSLQSRSEALRLQLEDSKNEIDPKQNWIDLAHSILNMKEFIYVR